MKEVRKLSQDRWKDYRALRLEALGTDPSAFGSSVDEEKSLPEEEWRRRIESVLFAMSGDEPVGLISYVFSRRVKTRHVASIFGVYVRPEHRGKGLGRALLNSALAEIRKKRTIVKVQLSVNPSFRPAVRLYRKAGFTVTGRSRNELKVEGKFYDLLSMEKEMRPAGARKRGGALNRP